MSTPEQNGLQPLEGEAGIPPVTEEKTLNVSAKAVFAVLLLAASVVTGGTLLIRRAMAPDPAKVEAKELAEAPKPVSVTSTRPKVEAPPDPPAQAASTPPQPTVPELEPDDDVKPIPVREPGAASPAQQKTKLDPMDAPLMIVSDAKAVRTAMHQDTAAEGEPAQPRNDGLDDTRANLNQYRQQLQGMLSSLQGMTNQVQGATGGGTPAAGTTPPVPNPQAAADLASSLMNQAPRGTPRVSASTLGDRSLTLPRGTTFTCALKTQVITSASGPISCQVMRHVYSDDGRILLVERGSHLDGEYRMQNVRPGMVAIPATWQRLRMPNGVTIELLDSTATGPLGAAGIDGTVDNRWPERLGAAMLVSLVDGAVKIAIANAQDSDGSVVVSQAGQHTTQLADEVLKSTINLPPILFKNQGGIVGVYVQKDLDFGSVYELRTKAQ